VLTPHCKHIGGVGAEADEVVGGSKNGDILGGGEERVGNELLRPFPSAPCGGWPPGSASMLLGRGWQRVAHGGCFLAVGHTGGDGVRADGSRAVEVAAGDGGAGEDNTECDECHSLLHELQGW
jgi:hypothetical protein